LATATATADDVPVWLVESVTTAVREKLPAEGGVQATVYGAATTSAPICD